MLWPFPCHINVHVTAPYHQIQLRESRGLEFKKWERGQMNSKGLKEDKPNIMIHGMAWSCRYKLKRN